MPRRSGGKGRFAPTRNRRHRIGTKIKQSNKDLRRKSREKE